MSLRPGRLVLIAIAWIALGGSAYIAVHEQQQIEQRRASLKVFEASAGDATDALADAQAGQQAYVAVGQDAREWMPKVAAYLQTASTAIDALRPIAHSQAAGPALLDASATVTQMVKIDQRLREHVAGGETRAASELVFSQAADAASSAVSDLATATAAEQQSTEGLELSLRRVQMNVLGGATVLVGLIVAVLGLVRPVTDGDVETGAADDLAPEVTAGLMHAPADDAGAALTSPAPPPSAAALRDIAALCTEFARARTGAELTALLEKSAGAMNARGLIVWLGDPDGADLRPVLAHGYSDATLARIRHVPRTADNAAAAAYRTGALQVVPSRPGASQGAIVAPLLAAEGCIGALTAEVRDRGEESESTRALALIVAAELAGVLAATADASAATPSLQARPAAG